MLIDWFTVVAQVVNFMVLVLLMKRFFFGRLVAAIDARESRIAGRLAEADAKKQAADLEAGKLNARAQEDARNRAELLAQTQRDAAELRTQMIREARETVQALERKWRDELDREKKVFLDDARRRTTEQILTVIRHALADLASADLQHCAVQVFKEKLRSMDVTAIRKICGDGELTVITAGELSRDERCQIQHVLEEKLGQELNVDFIAAPEPTWGIELRAGGRRIGWNSDSYVDALEQNLREALDSPKEPLLQTVA
jgi:F-type H+-transporting ATPase subunit b